MKKFGIFAATILIPAAGWADIITSPGAGLVTVPLTFQSTTGTNGGLGSPYWNNNSLDGMNMNAGDYLGGVNPSLGSNNYLSSGGGFGSYLSTGASGLDAPTNFSFLQTALSVNVTLLYTNAAANIGPHGTEIGLYNVQDPTQRAALFAHGTLNNPYGGIYNNNSSPLSPFSANTWANYGIYATTCDYFGVSCNTYYSNSGLNPAGETPHQHFVLFQNAQDPQTYFIGFEDIYGMNATEGYGDFNDAIFRLQTTTSFTPRLQTESAVPEPGTFSVLGLGLVGLGLLRRRRKIAG
jgi:hypothetical protein